VGGDGVDDLVAEAAGSVGLRLGDEFRDVSGTALRDEGAEAGFEEVAFFLTEVDAAGLGHIVGEQREVAGIFREIKHVPRVCRPFFP